MAIIKLGGVVVGVRGTIGGVTYSANKSGAYCKMWAKGANPRSPGQQLRRGILASVAVAWNGLSSSQQTDWDDYAATDPEPHTNSLGEAVTFSGYSLFSMFNQRRVAATFDILEDVPTGDQATQPDPVTIDTFDPHLGDLLTWLDWTATGSVEFDRMPTFMSLVPSTGAVAPFSLAKFLGFYSLSHPPVVNFPFFVQPWGEDVSGWNAKLWCYWQRESGIRSVVATAVGNVAS
jgi:hypothetical protein